jgi:hypothetical protein
MPNLGTKYVCFSCQTKFYDLGREVAVCPKCGADQKDADSAPAPVSKSRRVVETIEDDAEIDESPERDDDADDDVDLVEEEPDSESATDADDDEEEEEFD